jgi:hypothetical protein
VNAWLAAYNAAFSCIPFFAGAFANACSSMHSLEGCQTDFHWRMNATHSFDFLVVHSPMHTVVKQALRKHSSIQITVQTIHYTFSYVSFVLLPTYYISP